MIWLAERDGFAVCDKTFPIIPPVLIENGLKYAIGDTDLRIAISPAADAERVAVTVSKLATLSAPLTDAVFERGYRGTKTGRRLWKRAIAKARSDN